jgi:hypothetical protein
MNRVLLLAFLAVTAIALLSLRKRRVKFEVEFEMEPGDETDEE